MWARGEPHKKSVYMTFVCVVWVFFFFYFSSPSSCHSPDYDDWHWLENHETWDMILFVAASNSTRTIYDMARQQNYAWQPEVNVLIHFDGTFASLRIVLLMIAFGMLRNSVCVYCVCGHGVIALHTDKMWYDQHIDTHTHSKWRQRGNEAKIWLWWTISHDSLSVDDRRVARWNPFYLQSFFLSASVSLSLYSPLSIVHLSIFNRSSQSLGWSLAHLVSANDYNIVCVIIDTCIEYTFEPGLCETCLRVYDVRCPMINQSRWCARNDLHRCGLWSISLVTGHCAVGIRSWIHSGRRVALQRHSIYIVYISILLLLKIIDREQSVAIFLFHACYARGMPLKPISSHTAHNTNTKNWLQNNEEQ